VIFGIVGATVAIVGAVVAAIVAAVSLIVGGVGLFAADSSALLDPGHGHRPLRRGFPPLGLGKIVFIIIGAGVSLLGLVVGVALQPLERDFYVR
jgi:hypothetical protein